VTTWKSGQVQQSKLTLQIAVGILAVSLPINLEFSPQPPTDPATGVPMHHRKRRGVGSVTEVIGPPAQHLIDLPEFRGHHTQLISVIANYVWYLELSEWGNGKISRGAVSKNTSGTT
jgi:hypothetical protein